MARHPAICLQALRPRVGLSCPSREAALWGGRSTSDTPQRPKALGDREERGAESRVLPTPARARGLTRAAAAGKTLVLQRLLLDKVPDSRAGGLSLPGKPEAEVSSRGWWSSGTRAWKPVPQCPLGAAWGRPEVQRILRHPPPVPPPRLSAQDHASPIN